MADDGFRSSVVHHDRRAVGGAGAGGRVMAALIPYRWFANDLSNGCLMMVSNSTKARVEGTPRASGSARRSAGQERAVELAVTRREASCNTNCT